MCVWVSLQKAFFVFILALLLKSFVQKKVEEETDKIKNKETKTKPVTVTKQQVTVAEEAKKSRICTQRKTSSQILSNYLLHQL